MIDKNRFKTWHIDEKGASEVCDKNIQFLATITETFTKKCANPDCGWPISAIRTDNFGALGYGDVCATCHDMFVAITFMNPHLRNPKYFMDLHEQWKKELEEEKRKKRRNMEGGL